jgi:hypothetical protein
MMRGPPRTFVGSVVVLLDGPPGDHLTDAVVAAVGALPGVSRCALDAAAGTLLVTAREPVDHADVVAVLDRVGCRVRT